MRIIAFNDFVSESARGELYHFTTIAALGRILNDDMLRGWEQGWVSLTRNPEIPWWDRRPVRLTLDGSALRARVRTVPFLYDPSRDEHYGGAHAEGAGRRRELYGEEREERVRGDIPRLHLYLTGVDAVASTARDHARIAGVRADHPEIPIRIVQSFAKNTSHRDENNKAV